MFAKPYEKPPSFFLCIEKHLKDATS